MLNEELIAKIRGIQIRARHLVSDTFAGEYQSAFKGRGIEFEEVREYFPGDDIRTIDWNVTARAGRPFVKLFRDERELTVVFLVDVSGSSGFGSGARLKNEVSAEIAALLAYTALRNNDKVGMLMFSDHVERYIPAKKGRGHVWQIIREILSYRAVARRTDLSKPLDFLNRVLKRRSIVFLISDFLEVEMGASLSVAARRHDLVAIRVRDKREEEIPKLGFVEWRDAETGERRIVNTSSRDFQERFLLHRQNAEAERSNRFRRDGIEEIEVLANEDFLDPVIKYFKRREGRK